MPSTFTKNWNKMKEAGWGKKKRRYFSALAKQNQPTAVTAYRRSAQRHSHLTRGLASCIWHQLPRLDKQCLVGILNHLMRLEAVLQREVCSSQLAGEILKRELRCKL